MAIRRVCVQVIKITDIHWFKTFSPQIMTLWSAIRKLFLRLLFSVFENLISVSILGEHCQDAHQNHPENISTLPRALIQYFV